MGCSVRKSSRPAKEPEGSVFALCTAPLSSGQTLVHEGVETSEFRTLRAHRHPVSQMLGLCFVLGLWLGAGHRVQVPTSGDKKAIHL